LVTAVVVAVALPLIGATIGISLASHAEPVFESQAVAVATKQSIPAQDLAQVALAVFATDDVLDQVRSELSLAETPAQLLANGTLTAEAAESSVAIRITAQSADPAKAQQMADSATESLTRTLESTGIAKLTTFPASRPSVAHAPPRTLYAVLGAAGGLALVVISAWVAWLILRRRDRLGEEQPPATTGAEREDLR
jgi:capsular polysaccharide biosynthesis protein